MKIAGIILIILQLVSLAGGFPTAPGNSVYSFGFYLGYFLPAIIGVILLVKGINKQNASGDEGSWICPNCNASNPSNLQACPKCGTRK